MAKINLNCYLYIPSVYEITLIFTWAVCLHLLELTLFYEDNKDGSSSLMFVLSHAAFSPGRPGPSWMKPIKCNGKLYCLSRTTCANMMECFENTNTFHHHSYLFGRLQLPLMARYKTQVYHQGTDKVYCRPSPFALWSVWSFRQSYGIKGNNRNGQCRLANPRPSTKNG